MNTKSTAHKEQQAISREAALKCAALLPDGCGLGPTDFEAIILAAVEEAMKEGEG